MSEILIVAEHANGKLNPSTAKCVTAASKISGAKIAVAVFAASGAAVAAEAARLAGVNKVITVDHAANEHALAAVIAPQVAALAAPYSHVFGPSTTFGKDLMPRIAAILDAPQLSDVMAIESATRFVRPIYASNAIITVEVEAGAKIVATVRTASFEAAATGGNAAPIEAGNVDVELPKHTRFVGLAAAKSDRPDLQTAARVISGGRALGSADAFKIIYSLAEKLGAGVGASRAAVDAGYAPNDMQVGQTGKIIAPELYIAIGISGAIQHLTGIKDARTIVAINKDSEAPIFEVADIGLVGDLFSIVPELEKQIAAGK
ncbi:MAG: FAD-binding protein [Pseudomonadales bacterium]|nr:FAD-binding protein [Pseudomonadales bacterium]